MGVSLIMRGPGGFSGGKVCDAMVSHIDLFPTICDLVGIEHPSWLQGKSLLP
jgi:arylsulfatase A-like enzyme